VIVFSSTCTILFLFRVEKMQLLIMPINSKFNDITHILQENTKTHHSRPVEVVILCILGFDMPCSDMLYRKDVY